MANLKIVRPQKFLAKYKKFKILVDGQDIGDIADGETMEFDLAQGAHKMCGKSRWRGSKEIYFSITGNEMVTYSLSRTNYNTIAFIIAIFIIFRRHFLDQYIDKGILVFIQWAGIIFILLNFTVFRNKHLEFTRLS